MLIHITDERKYTQKVLVDHSLFNCIPLVGLSAHLESFCCWKCSFHWLLCKFLTLQNKFCSMHLLTLFIYIYLLTGERYGMWISKCFEFSNGSHCIPSVVVPDQQVTSDPCLDPLGLISTQIREPCFRQTWVHWDKIIFVMSGLLKIDYIYYRQRLC